MYEPFVPENHRSLFEFPQVYRAYLDCRRSKRSSISALTFEIDQEEYLLDLSRELREGRYQPTTSVCFYTRKPKCREIFAANFRDRIVHHLLYRYLAPRWEKVFIAHSYACRPAKGTHASANALQAFLRAATCNGRRRGWYLKMDIRNFFMSIDQRVLMAMLARRCPNPAMRGLLARVVFHNPTRDYQLQDRDKLRFHLPPHKSLFNAGPFKGLPIGNLTSQFFANVYLNALDQFVKHKLKVRHYLRYVDDFVLVCRERTELQHWEQDIKNFLKEELRLEINPRATRLAPVSGGVDFAGYIVRPHYRLVRRRVVGNFKERLRAFESRFVEKTEAGQIYHVDGEALERLLATVNAYLGQFSHAATKRLIEKLWREFPFLDVFFTRKGYVVKRIDSKLLKATLLRGQVRWLQQQFSQYLSLIQIGLYYELFDRQAETFAELSGYRLFTNWRGYSYGCGFPKWCLTRVEQLLHEQRIPYMLVKQTGREQLHTRQREIRKIVAFPGNTQLNPTSL